MENRKVNLLYQKLNKQLSNARTELIFKNTFELLISVMLSAQANDKIVNATTPELFSSYPTPGDIIKCGENKLKNIIQPIGLAPTKARNIIKTCSILVEKHDSNVPGTRAALEKLPGVGRKTANVVLNEGFGHPTIAVDTHVFRVANRTGLAPGKSVALTEKRLLEVTPTKWKLNAHRYLILHGRYVCKAKNFNCSICTINKECEYSQKVFK